MGEYRQEISDLFCSYQATHSKSTESVSFKLVQHTNLSEVSASGTQSSFMNVSVSQ